MVDTITNRSEAASTNQQILEDGNVNDDGKRIFEYHDEVVQLFHFNRQFLIANSRLTSIGRNVLLARIDKLHQEYKTVLNYIALDSESVAKELPKVGPIIICGLPRTGSTILYNLLSCDPACRAPFLTDMCIDPVPPIKRANRIEHERRRDKLNFMSNTEGKLFDTSTSIFACHPTYQIEEDSYISEHVGFIITLVFLLSPDQNLMDDWFYNQENKNVIYKYHETFLRLLNSADVPKSHWILKSPEHALFLDNLLKYHPRARIIMTHRHLAEVMPSYCSLVRAYFTKYFDLKDENTITRLLNEQAINHLDKIIERTVKFRDQKNYSRDFTNKIIDVDYRDLMENPIDTVRRIYDHFELAWSTKFEVGMKIWLSENPQGKQGRHSYDLRDIGLNCQEIEERYATYMQMFNIPRIDNMKEE